MRETKGATGGIIEPTKLAMPSEEEMLKLLSKKYSFKPISTSKVETSFLEDPVDVGTKPKVPSLPSMPPLPGIIPPSHFPFTPTTPSFISKPPKIPPFSGDEPVRKNELTFYE